MKAKPKTETRDVAIIALDPLAEFCNANVGSKIDLANRMTGALGYKIHRQIAEGWVHADRNRRVEPKLGQGIVLLLVGAEMMKGSKRLNLGPIVKKGLNGHAKPKASPHDKKARPAHGKRPRPAKSDLRKEFDDAMYGVQTQLTPQRINPPRRKPKADVRKAIAPAKQFPAAPPKPRKS